LDKCIEFVIELAYISGGNIDSFIGIENKLFDHVTFLVKIKIVEKDGGFADLSLEKAAKGEI